MDLADTLERPGTKAGATMSSAPARKIRRGAVLAEPPWHRRSRLGLPLDATGNIVEAHQYDDCDTNRFFSRIVFTLEDQGRLGWLRHRLEAIAERFQITWRLNPEAPRRVMILVSKFDHCLVDLLYRWRIGELPIIPRPSSQNHAVDHFAHIDFTGVPFHDLLVTKTNKVEQEADLWELVKSTRSDLVVLARYMQVLSDDLSAKLAGRCINIHHSFLPASKAPSPITRRTSGA